MLRRVEVKDRWRSLDNGFWPEDLPLGRASVIYGHNGSGKSTVADLLLSLGEGRAATGVTWEQPDRRKVTVPLGTSAPSSIAVFTRTWVDENLSEFLAGENANAIVTLGRAAIDSKEKEQELKEQIEARIVEADEADDLRKKAQQDANRVVRDVQDRIVDELQRFDYGHYSKNRYSVVKVAEMLRSAVGEFPDNSAHADALVRLGEGAPSAIPQIASSPKLDGPLRLGPLLSDTPTRVAIEELETENREQAWVERGLELHRERDDCLFCGCTLSAVRREQLARHFDASWFRIRSEAESMLTKANEQKKALVAWLESLPDHSALAGDLQVAFEQDVEEVRREVGARVSCLESAEQALAAKVADPSAQPDEPDCAVLAEAVPSAALSATVRSHNEQVAQHEALTADRKTVVLEHVIGSQGRAYRDLETQARAANEAHGAAASAAQLAQRALESVRQEQFTTAEMAETLTRDLARVYGKEHLSIAVTDDGKSYACRRGDGAGTNLSEGERTTLSLLYFLRSLEDKQGRGVDPAERIVVIDDPSSSLDREALFATHQWLVTTLKGFGQYVVLTHDFSLLRLFISSHSSKWNASAKAIGDGNEDEIRFPRVAFLEMFAATTAGSRTTRVGQLPPLLRNSTSEYAYLFAMVMRGVQEAEDHERLFLLPNAARRVLETFASYKAPHRPNFLQQLEVLVESDPDEPYRDVYDFCNRFSHGEGSETVEVLDARAVHGQIRRCMQFLRTVDEEHFDNMCAAVRIDPTALPKL